MQPETTKQTSTPASLSMYERMGGEPVLREVVRDFVQRFYKDMIIGFFFTKIDQEQLLQREFEHASQRLGGPHTYQGRPIGPTHRPHRINAGQFNRRLWIVEQTLHKHDVPPDIIEYWLQEERKLFNSITQGRTCVD
ncbi:MAG: group 1 truncated hemoglobin [Myxococcales bacterium]|nr:group 1 truncated hemoglobin [Myxococcales bacterium]